MENKFILSAFTKFWKDETLAELAEIITGLGFNAVEFALREGYQAEPSTAEKSLPAAAKTLGERGVKITSVASSTDENIFAACALADVPLIRIMFGSNVSKNYFEAESEMKRKIEGFLPFCEKYKVKVGVQQHCGPGINNSMEMYNLLKDYDADLVGGIWDAAHSALAGEAPEQALDIISGRLMLVNFKNAFFRRMNGPEAEEAVFEWHFTTARQGKCSWKRALTHLKKIGYEGVICLPVEYTDLPNTTRYAAEDCAYIKELIDEVYGEGHY